MMFVYAVCAGAATAVVAFVVGNFIKGFMQAVRPIPPAIAQKVSRPQLRIFNPEG